MNTGVLDEAKVNIRVKLACLWVALMFLYVYGDYFALYIPGEAGKLVSGDTLLNNPFKVFAASILMAIPPLVIIACVMARPAVARILNIIFGFIFTAIMLMIAATSIDPEWAAYVFYAFVESAITLVIVWQAWNWPKNS